MVASKKWRISGNGDSPGVQCVVFCILLLINTVNIGFKIILFLL